LKAIIFDVDGVLIHSKDESGKYLWQKNIQMDLCLNSEQVFKIYSSADWILVMKGFLSMQQHLKNVFTELNIALSIDEFIEYWLNLDFNLNTEILQEIKSIKGPKLYIGTNQDSLRTAFLQERFATYFDGFFSSCEIGAIKPELKFFKHIESNLSLQAKDIVFIDDSLSHIQAAVQLGWTCHHYENIEKFKDFIRVLRIP
jgi:putative hydrolase of the HAD superfamily